ncbi:DUF4129 domain-containing protein [Salinithrix halophila]|uniref:DUF4129 domain-containing protein n=1 Tax=Salinithrix halophila TaxID=1485204 RepID=A0ABV8JG80_9BACL
MSIEYEKARQQLTDILNSREFTGQRWLDIWLHRIDSWMNEIVRILGGGVERLLGVEVDTRIGWLLPLLLTGILLFVLGWVGRRLYWGRRIPGFVAEREPDAMETASSWWDKGEAFAAEGDYKEGVRCLYRAVLEYLDERGVLLRDVFKANRDYREEVSRRRPDLLPLFAGITFLFDRIRYGAKETGEGDYREFHSLSQKLVKGGGNQ